MNLTLILLTGTLLILVLNKNLFKRMKRTIPYKGASMRDWMSMNREQRHELNRNYNLNTI